MFENIVATKVGQVEAVGEWVLGAGPDRLREQKKSIRVLNVVSAEHAVGQCLEVEVLAVARDVAMVSQSIEAGTGPTSFIK
jgi:hypothetical protein